MARWLSGDTRVLLAVQSVAAGLRHGRDLLDHVAGLNALRTEYESRFAEARHNDDEVDEDTYTFTAALEAAIGACKLRHQPDRAARFYESSVYRFQPLGAPTPEPLNEASRAWILTRVGAREQEGEP